MNLHGDEALEANFPLLVMELIGLEEYDMPTVISFCHTFHISFSAVQKRLSQVIINETLH